MDIYTPFPCPCYHHQMMCSVLSPVPDSVLFPDPDSVLFPDPDSVLDPFLVYYFSPS